MTWLLSPQLNMMVGAAVTFTAVVWTILALSLTSEPANVIAMSGFALVLAGFTMMQNALTMRKIEVTEA